jgi:hypothetical protein
MNSEYTTELVWSCVAVLWKIPSKGFRTPDEACPGSSCSSSTEVAPRDHGMMTICDPNSVARCATASGKSS